jgi:site-specific recombinase XerD
MEKMHAPAPPQNPPSVLSDEEIERLLASAKGDDREDAWRLEPVPV